MQVFTLAFGEEEEEGEDNIGDISKGLENLDISGRGDETTKCPRRRYW